MVVSRRKLGLLAALGLLLVALLPAACSRADIDWMTTTTTLLFPSQKSFIGELCGDGYSAAPIVFTVQQGGTIRTVVWIAVDPDKVTPATYDAIFDHAVALAQKYGAADSTGGRLRVELFDSTVGGLIRDHILESRDFDLSGSGG